MGAAWLGAATVTAVVLTIILLLVGCAPARADRVETSTPAVTQTPTPISTSGWSRVDVPEKGEKSRLSFYLPPGWSFAPGTGYDTYVGWITSPDGLRLMLDYGVFVGQVVSPNDQDYGSYEVVWEPIGGYQAQLVRPKEGAIGVTGVYVDGAGGSAVSIATHGEQKRLSREQQDTLFAIFRSIR